MEENIAFLRSVPLLREINEQTLARIADALEPVRKIFSQIPLFVHLLLLSSFLSFSYFTFVFLFPHPLAFLNLFHRNFIQRENTLCVKEPEETLSTLSAAVQSKLHREEHVSTDVLLCFLLVALWPRLAVKGGTRKVENPTFQI